MTPPSRRRPVANVSGYVTRLVALVAPPGEDVTDEHRSREWEVLSVRRSAGANGDTATLFRRLDRAGRMRERTIAQLEPQQVEIWTADRKTNELDQPLMWGELDARAMTWSPSGESETGTVSVRPFHFGDPLRGMKLWNPLTLSDFVIEHDAEFNPLVDGRIVNNRYPTDPDHDLWLLPEASRTTNACEQQDIDAAYTWRLEYMIDALCRWLNEDEERIDNPTIADSMFLDAPFAKNIRLQRGQYLPQLLDALLPPHGYGWYLSYASEGGRVRPKIAIYQRGKGEHKALPYARIGKAANLSHSLDQLQLTADVGAVMNQVRCEGAIVERETTIMLQRAWPEANDDDDIADLTKSISGTGVRPGVGANGPVWRKWVANEAGDYNGLRTSVHATVAPDHASRSLNDVFGPGEWVMRRRHMEGVLGWENDDKTRRAPVRIEWSEDSGTTWNVVPPDWGAHVLQDEIGVMFTADSPPAEMYAAGPAARLRVTGTIKGDKRLTSTATRNTDNPQTSVSELVLDVSDQFHDRTVANSVISTTAAQRDEADDADALDEFAEAVRDNSEAVQLSASIGLFGLHFDFAIGDIITEISGRDIKLNRLPGDTDGRYLQVVGIEWRASEQRTTLNVSQYDR